MSEETVAYQHLLATMLEIHRNNADGVDLHPDVDFVSFSEEEITVLVESLWANRFSESRNDFQDMVGQLINKMVAKR
jgi:hypothetical protein